MWTTSCTSFYIHKEQCTHVHILKTSNDSVLKNMQMSVTKPSYLQAGSASKELDEWLGDIIKYIVLASGDHIV